MLMHDHHPCHLTTAPLRATCTSLHLPFPPASRLDMKKTLSPPLTHDFFGGAVFETGTSDVPSPTPLLPPPAATRHLICSLTHKVLNNPGGSLI